jgi:hypothetical protein
LFLRIDPLPVSGGFDSSFKSYGDQGYPS